MDKRYQFFKKLTVYIVFFIVLIFALIKSKEFLVPILLAILFSYLLYPIAQFLEKRGTPRILSNLAAIFSAILILAGFIFFLSTQVSLLTEDLPRHMEQATTNINRIAGGFASLIGVPEEQLRQRTISMAADFIEDYGELLRSVFAVTTSTVVRIFLMPVYVFFLLYYRNKVFDVILWMAKKDQKGETQKIINEVNAVSTNYMTGLLIVVLILSITHSVALTIIGLEFAILIGVVAAIFNFIPYFGTLIGAIFPLVFGFLTSDTLTTVLWIAIYFVRVYMIYCGKVI
ncbi:AI-2E family transporter [Cytophagaceae bacterium ABcell3]|nr:AI-2E family transporter [Cytophagaceae bacterium ABcell3]